MSVDGQRQFELTGCSSEPLLNYLKGLGVLRLISEQADDTVRGWWTGNTFCLSTLLEEPELIAFFLDHYVPTPIVAPWNGGSGFYAKPAHAQAQKHLGKVESSKLPRYAAYRRCIELCRKILAELNIDTTPENETKERLLAVCRSRLPDETVMALDALYVLSTDLTGTKFKSRPRYAPVFGAGGVDGRLEFTTCFMNYLDLVIPTSEQRGSAAYKLSRQRLVSSLFERESPQLVHGPVGQFFPGGIGGPNSTRGFEGNSLVNPWDFVLAVEGILVFAGSVARRMAGMSSSTVAAFPFSVKASAAGWGPIAEEEADRGSRGELWLPLWTKPAVFPEVRHLFAEGRVAVGRRAAATGTDFVRAIAGLGVDRGVDTFQRIGFLSGSRNGNMVIAAPLGLFPVRSRPEARLIDEVDHWLGRFRVHASSKGSSARLRLEQRRVEDAIFSVCRHGGSRRMQEVVAALGAAELALGVSKEMFTDSPPIEPLTLSSRWLRAVDDGSPEFRIAAAVASITGQDNEPLRENLEPVRLSDKTKRCGWARTTSNVAVTDAVRTFSAILDKRVCRATSGQLDDLGLFSRLSVSPADVELFLSGRLDETRVLQLVAGLAMINYAKLPSDHLPRWDFVSEPGLDRGYALLKLVFLPGPLTWPRGAEPARVRPEVAVLGRLRGSDVHSALMLAGRRLRASGFTLLFDPAHTSLLQNAVVKSRLAAALLIPVSGWRSLAATVLLDTSMSKSG